MIAKKINNALTCGLFKTKAEIGAICCCVWLLVALLARMSSLSYLISATSAPITALVLNKPQVSALLIFLATIVFFRHQQNIARILKGVEPKIGKSQ